MYMDEASAASAPYAPRVRDVMSRCVALGREDDKLAFASQIMLWRGLRHLPVVDDDDRLVGMLSDRDLLRYVLEGPAGALPLRSVMTKPVETVEPDVDLTEASARLALTRIDCLPVVKDGKMLGILTTTDVLAERGRLLHKSDHGRIPTASDIMSGRVVVAHLGESLISAVQKLVDSEIRHLPVVDAEFRAVGMLSDRDVRTAVGDPLSVLERQSDDDLAALCVDSIMTTTPHFVSPAASVLEVASMLVDDQIGALLVVNEGEELLGIISYVDVIAHLTGRGRRS
jgi:CBS domain-containing protein